LSDKTNAPKCLKICLVASAGGHTSQLLKLASSWNGYETVYVTTTDVVRKKLTAFGHVYVAGECNRQQPIRVLRVLLRCIKIILKEKPDVVMSTGAAAGCILCFLGKMLGAKVVWIDSITNVNHISLAGRMVRHIADLFIVQWPGLAARYRNAEFVGTVI
jgi:UDP-N-acetylglucosamine:LPS N-acetylglucosamine transferase